MQSLEIEKLMREIGVKARIASRQLAVAGGVQKRNALLAAATEIENRCVEIEEANRIECGEGKEKSLTSAMLDRLLLNPDRIASIADGLRAVADQEDPVGEVIADWQRPSGLSIQRVRTPLGVVGVIYESRPNVTADAGALCLKSGNAAILRCGSECLRSSTVIHECLVAGCKAAALPEDSIQLVPTVDRKAVGQMLQMTEHVDVIVPRGGKSLVSRVQREARVPIFAHLEGIVHVYVDKSADMAKARAVIMNAKTRRPGICGAAECLLIDKTFYESSGAPFISELIAAGVEVRGDQTLQEVDGVKPATDGDFGCEFLEMIIAAKVVDGVEQAVEHIQKHGSNHTECILAEDNTTVEYFFKHLDSAILMHNASTQFADGGEFGMGAEIGIATGKLHARGPVGAQQLTSFKYLVRGDGTVRK